jgi:uncharacterized membrane protein YfcA
VIELVVVFLGSLVAGYLGSAIGLVLGTLRLPILLVAAGSPAAGAGTNIAISAAAAASGGLRHAREGRVDWRVVVWMAPPSVVGAVAGALFADEAPDAVLYGGVAAILLWQGWDLLLRPFREHPRAEPRYGPGAALGLVIGVVGGALGVILGTLRMPALLHAVGLSAAKAVGTNLVIGFLLGVAGFATHAAQLNVEWDLLVAGLAGALPGAWLGAHHTGGVSEQTLRRAIGVALLMIAATFAFEAVLALR